MEMIEPSLQEAQRLKKLIGKEAEECETMKRADTVRKCLLKVIREADIIKACVNLKDIDRYTKLNEVKQAMTTEEIKDLNSTVAAKMEAGLEMF